VSFSTDAFPERDRLAILREQFGRKIARLDFEPLTERFQFNFAMRSIGNLGLMTIDHSLTRVERTRELASSDGSDALVLNFTTGRCRASQLGREITSEPGGAFLGSVAEVGTFVCSTVGTKALMVMLARDRLRLLIRDFDAALLRPIPAQTQALWLLLNYLRIFEDGTALTPQLQQLAVDHVYDLAAVMFGATRDAAEQAQRRGLQAARLRAVKADILANLGGDRSLSLDAVARRHNISPVYIRKLFDGENTSFTQFVLDQRLARAYRLLSDPRLADRTISSLAIEAGFNDVSYFNRCFRRRYEVAPSEVRASARPRERD